MSMTGTTTKIRYQIRDLAHENCDSCGAAGKLMVLLMSGRELVFCGHHANRNVANIVRQALGLFARADFDMRVFGDRVELAR